MPALSSNRPLAAAVLATVLSACGNDVPPDPTLHLHDVRLTLLHTADWHSRLFPYQQSVSATDQGLGLNPAKAPFGGAARMNWLIQRERAHADRVLHLDSGDCFEGAPIFNFFNGEAEVRALGHTGVDAVVIGNHEFDKGAANFARQYSRWATFPVLAANYQFEDPTTPGSAELSRLAKPYAFFNLDGLKVAVIGFGNLSSITSLFDQPNRPGITPLDTIETAQFYLDQVQALGADVVVGVSHLGLTDDQQMIAHTSGFDVILGGHLHIVLDPPQQVRDCEPFDLQGHHFIAIPMGSQRNDTCDASRDCCDPSGVCRPEPTLVGQDPSRAAWRVAPGYTTRSCSPRTVVLQHSGAFMKYLGRLDVMLSDDPARIGDARLGDAGVAAYDPKQRFEVIAQQFSLFPVDSTVPSEPTMARLLEPYSRALDTLANLDTLVGYSPDGVSRTNVGGGDSPMGNLVTTAMWQRLGVQTDLALTNTLGIRDAIPAGPVSTDQVFNVFPFDNTITTLQLSGREVREMFDFIARRSSGRGCNSQAQIAGARVVITCGGCDRDGVPGTDVTTNADGTTTPATSCAQTVNIGLARTRANHQDTGVPASCDTDADCNPTDVAPEQRSLCEPHAHRCMQPLSLNASYALAANDYIAGGGSGFFVLQRNTTQINTGVNLRDAVIDFVRATPPCGYDEAVATGFRAAHPDNAQQPDDGLMQCMVDADCTQTGYVCACADRVTFDETSKICNPNNTCAAGAGRCVLQQCRDDVARLEAQRCTPQDPPGEPGTRDRCLCGAASRAGVACRILSCVGPSIGADSDGRLQMVSVQ